MSRRRTTPPRAARALLEWLLPAGDLGAATGDLDEEYAKFVYPDRGKLSADVWYWRQVILSAPRLLAARLLSRPNGGSAMVSFAGDVRVALRLLRRRPGFTVAAVSTLALGLGVNTIAFSVVNTVLVRPLPFDQPERLVRPLPDELFFIDSREAILLAERMTTWESFAAWGRTLFLFSEGGEAEEVRGARVSWNHFDMLGAEAFVGRTFQRSDAAADDAIILSHGLWERRFGSDRSLIGTTIDLFGREVRVIGVMSPDHVPMEFDWEAWRAIPLDPERIAGAGLAANARLRDGVTLDQARIELQSVLPSIWAEDGYFASAEEKAGLDMVPLGEWLIGDARQVLLVLAAAVGFLLLLACANVASLLITQTGSRAREFAVRTALGGSRARVARQLFVEVLVLCSIGAVVALAASSTALGWFAARLPHDLPRGAEVTMSGGVVAFVAALTLLVAFVTGTLPALRGLTTRADPLALSSRGASSGRERARLRSMLVGAEMAIAVVLTIGAGLMIRTMSSLRLVDPGFVAEGVITVRPSPPASRYPPGPELDEYYERLTTELARLPGVTSVGAIQFLPMTPGGWWTSYQPEGLVLANAENAPNTAMRVVRGDYFETMQIALIRGRLLESRDGEPDSPTAAVVNETFAAEAFPGESAVGRTVLLDEERISIVGVVADVRQSDLRTGSHAEMYIPFGKQPWQRMHIVLRTSGQETAAGAGAASAVRSLDAQVSMLGPRPMSEVLGSTFDDARLLTTVLTIFGLVGLGLGAVGVYGVTAQAVAERRREIGIRIALGAATHGVVAETVRHGMTPVLLGVALGLAIAAAGGRVLEGLLFGVDARDAETFLTAPSLLLLVALISLSFPAMRASRVDPMRTLMDD